MKKKGYNWKARQVVNTIIDDTPTKKIELELQNEGRYDSSNPLVLPSQKRQTKIKKDKTQVTRLLSKKKRKLLEKVVEKKQKKEQRASLLEALSHVQATPEELAKLTSITSIQTKGLKRYFFEEQNEIKKGAIKEGVVGEMRVDSLAGAKRKPCGRREVDYDKNDANIVGFESSGDSSEEEEEIEEKRQKLDCVITEEVVEVKGDAEEVKTDAEEVKTDCEDAVEVKTDEVVEVQPEDQKIIEIKEEPRKPSVFVEVHRTEEIQTARLKLPILAEEQQIMELINENSVVLIAGETGSGKTTQIPQFLYEAGYALKQRIGITEPRRVAAISMSQRVAEEMNLSTREVSYLIRFEGNVTEDTKIKFMTDGVLLKEIESDFLLTKYSVIILDEAHERSVYTDILIGLLSRIVPLRLKRNNPLKLVIMSATLRLEDFTENRRLFKTPPPVFKVDVRQYPVTIHFNKRTNENYLKEAFNKAVKIHTKLPDGGILIFLTGQQEVKTLVRKLRNAFPLRHKSKILQMQRPSKSKKVKVLPKINLDDYSICDDNDDLLSSEGELSEDSEQETLSTTQPLWVLPLYSLLPANKQAEVFKPPPAGCRLCIVSTNVAETSLTIPNVKYVIDSGKTKLKLYDKLTGVNSFAITWTSKASADQRAGRAGRLGPGHCYRLYSSAVFNDEFPQFNIPDIQQKPIDDLFLQLKCMKIHKVINFPFPTAPDILQLKSAEGRLNVLGVLKEGKVTALGKVVARFPVLPRFGKMLALSHQFDLLPYTICLVAALSVQEVLLETPIGQMDGEKVKEIRQKWSAIRKQWANIGNFLLLGDNMVLLRAVGAAEYANSEGKLEKFCHENGLRHKAITEIRKLRLQLTNAIKINVPDADITVDPRLAPPTDLQAKLLRQLLLAGMGEQVAKKIMPDEVKEGENKAKFKYAYNASNLEEPVFLHQGSVLKDTLPEYVIFQEIYETNKMYMRGVTAIEPEWLVTYVPNLCNLSEPLKDPEPSYNSTTGKIYCTVNGTFGPQAWPIPNTEIEFPTTLLAYKWFARFLLEGKVFGRLEKYAKGLLSTPSTMVKTWARLQPRTESLLKALIAKEIVSKGGLLEVWEENPKYLLHEYLQWLPASVQTEVTLFWPPTD